jgi:hypothetical protein
MDMMSVSLCLHRIYDRSPSGFEGAVNHGYSRFWGSFVPVNVPGASRALAASPLACCLAPVMGLVATALGTFAW